MPIWRPRASTLDCVPRTCPSTSSSPYPTGSIAFPAPLPGRQGGRRTTNPLKWPNLLAQSHTCDSRLEDGENHGSARRSEETGRTGQDAADFTARAARGEYQAGRGEDEAVVPVSERTAQAACGSQACQPGRLLPAGYW